MPIKYAVGAGGILFLLLALAWWQNRTDRAGILQPGPNRNGSFAQSLPGASTVRSSIPRTLRPLGPELTAALASPTFDLSRLAPNALEHLGALEDHFEEAHEVGELSKMLILFQELAILAGDFHLPASIMWLTDHVDPSVHSLALAITARSNDPKGHRLLIEILRDHNADKVRISEVIRACQYSRSPAIAEALNAHISLAAHSPSLATDLLRTLKYAGQSNNVEALRAMVQESQDARLKREAKTVLALLEVIAAPDRDAKLMSMLNYPLVSGDFSSSRWALDRMVRAELRHLVPFLRAHYSERNHLWSQTGPTSFRILMLDAIFRLGGELSEEERRLLRDSGRLP